MYEIRKAYKPEDIKDIADLGAIIWAEHYTPIIGSGQVDYMVEKFQSPGAIMLAIENDNYTYYGIYTDDNELAGYCGIRPEKDNIIFLSKLYIAKEHRGQGLSHLFLERIISDNPECKSIYLTVNKNNTSSIAVYKRLGFEISRELKSDIGQGFVMDDYIMEYFL